MTESETTLINSKDSSNKPSEKTVTQKFLGELIGTAALLTFPCYAAIKSNGNAVLVTIAFATTIISLSYSFGNISGCHLNPAVSFNNLLRKNMKFSEFIYYIIAQNLGALLGSFTVGVISRNFSNLCSTTIQQGIYNEKGQKDFYTYVMAVFCEVLMTFFFVFVINGATDKRYNDPRLGGIIIGCAICFVSIPGGNWTGCSMNPARYIIIYII